MKAWLGVHSLNDAGLMMAARYLFKSSDQNENGVVERSIKKAWPHPEFDSSTFRNDIAVLEMEIPVKISPVLYPLCLPIDGKLLFF